MEFENGQGKKERNSMYSCVKKKKDEPYPQLRHLKILCQSHTFNLSD